MAWTESSAKGVNAIGFGPLSPGMVLAAGVKGKSVLDQDMHGEVRMWDDWKSLAKRKGYACCVCARTPDFDQRHIYFKTGKCAACASPDRNAPMPSGDRS